MPNIVTKTFLLGSDLIAILLSQFEENTWEKMEITDGCMRLLSTSFRQMGLKVENEVTLPKK
jgi:hypothetical protein